MSAAVREHFRRQAQACERLGSPFTARLCNLLADGLDRSTAIGRTVLDWQGAPGDDALALRLCGALHRLVLSEADRGLAAVYPPSEADDERLAAEVSTAMASHDARLVAEMGLPPQTNEIARSGMLLPGLLAIARATGLPLALHEIGASAGLNQLVDRFHYDYRGHAWGDQASPVRLTPEVRGEKAVPLDGVLEIVSRSGCDIAPVDLADPTQQLRLRSFVWADQTARLARLDATIALAGTYPVSVVKQDAARFVEETLTSPVHGMVRVLMHSIMWQYMPLATRAGIEATMARLGAGARAEAPFAWLRMEPTASANPYATLSLTLWPDGATRDLAHCDYHGRWIEWL